MIFFQKPFGLNISDFSIELVSLSGSIETPKLSSLGRKELRPGIFEDGKILEKKELENVLKELILKPEFGKIKTKKFILALPESKSFTLFCQTSQLEKKKVLDFVKEKAKENFPYSIEEIYLDFQLKEKEVLIAAFPKEIVNDYLEIFSSCKISPLALETESLSLGRSLIEDAEATLILDLGSKFTNFVLFDKKRLKLSITNSIAGNSFSKSISEKLKISFEAAEDLKKEIGLNPKRKDARIFLILQKEIQKLIGQIREIEDYFLKKIEKIILTGGSSTLPYLKEYLADDLEKEVSIGDPWKKINIDILRKKEYFKEALKINPYLYSVAIGSALRGLEKSPERSGINLLKGIK